MGVARKLGLEVHPELTVQLEVNVSSPELGYPVVQQLLAQNRLFTALVSFNDVAAIGAIRAFRDHGLRVPEDVSIVGYDDVPLAALPSYALTTIRQPVREMAKEFDLKSPFETGQPVSIEYLPGRSQPVRAAAE